MHKLIIAAVVAALGIGPAQAAVTFNVNAALSNLASGGTASGTLTGTFTTNDARSMVTGYDLIASSFGSFTGFHYTTGNSTVSTQSLPSQYFRIDTAGNVNELQLYFASGLTSTGGTLVPASSYENEPSGGNRFASGTVTVQVAAVPELATWSMMIAGIGVIGCALRRRRGVRSGVRFA